jgi:hypothetical protein
MSQLTDKAQPAVEKLMEDTESQLYAELGRRSQLLQSEPEVLSDFDLRSVQAQGAADDLIKAGERFFNRLSIQAYGVLCGEGPQDQAERQELIEAFAKGQQGIAAAIAGLLVANLAIAPAIATVVATLIVRKVAITAYETMCELWGKSLNLTPATGDTPSS